MASITTLVSLVQSLTRGEKKYFTMQASVQKGAKDYLRLFRLISKGMEPGRLKPEFLRARHTASYETSCKYLFSTLTRQLVQQRQEKSLASQLQTDLLKAGMLFEKSLYEEGFQLLQKIRRKAAARELHLAELSACRLELDHYSQLNFHTITEKKLVQLQMHMEDLLRKQQKQQQHQNLYELMKFRRFHGGTTRSALQTAGLNDLVMSEMNILNALLNDSFQSEKAHLLFQSHYFLTTNDTASALKVFYQLNGLFEKNPALWSDQPSDYILMLEGILDSLRTLGRYEDLAVFLNKLKKLSVSASQVQLIIEKIIYLYELILPLDAGEPGKALLAVKKNGSLLKNMFLLNATRQAEVYLYTALTYFMNNDLHHAQQYLRSVLLENKLFYHLPVYKTFRLIRLLVHYQLNDHAFIHYEARSIKRSMQKQQSNRYQLEKTLLAFLQIDPLPARLKERHQIWEKLQPGFELMRKNKYELQLLKIFDFPLWVKAVLTKQPLSALLQARQAEA